MIRLVLAVAMVLGCAQGGTPVAPPGGALRIAASTTTTFDATFARGDAWARVEVSWTPATTRQRLVTSFGTTLALQGTAESSFALDARMESTDGFVLLNGNDREYEIVQGLLDALMAQGISATPTVAQKATPVYAAAYTTAEVLGLVMLTEPAYFYPQHRTGRQDGSGGMRDDGPRQVWPAPGYDDPSALPQELRLGTGFSCCGPANCTSGVMSDIIGACETWCAAGDHCDAGHSSRGCGALAPAAGQCAHANSAYLQSYGDVTRYLARHTTH